MKFLHDKRARHNLLLFIFNIIYIFVLGLFDGVFELRYAYNTVITLIFFASILSIRDSVNRFFYLPIIVMTLTWVTEFLDFDSLSHFTGIITLIFFFYIIVFLIIRVATTRKVSPLEFMESINVYLLLGIAASILFATIYSDSTTAFSMANETMDSRAEFIYFSFITMTTLGYGDIVPIDPAARSLVIFFSVTGQLYLTMIIAMLVGKYLSQITIMEERRLEKEIDKDKKE